MPNATRYFADPSRTSAGSWNVLDRTLPAGANVEVPHVTKYEAEQCADCLNRGENAWEWIRTAEGLGLK